MILKTVGKSDYKIEESTISRKMHDTNYYFNISHLDRHRPVEPKEGDCEVLTLTFNNGESISLILFDYENDTYKAVYEHVYLMNDKGETVERIL